MQKRILKEFTDILSDIVMIREWQKIDTQWVGRFPSGKKMAVMSTNVQWQIVIETRKLMGKLAFPISHLHNRGSCQSRSVERERLIWVPNHVQRHVLLSLKKKKESRGKNRISLLESFKQMWGCETSCRKLAGRRQKINVKRKLPLPTK